MDVGYKMNSTNPHRLYIRTPHVILRSYIARIAIQAEAKGNKFCILSKSQDIYPLTLV